MGIDELTPWWNLAKSKSKWAMVTQGFLASAFSRIPSNLAAFTSMPTEV